MAEIAARHGLGRVARVRPLAGGIVNPVLLLDERVVLKINTRDPGYPKVPKEAWILRFIAGAQQGSAWRVPAVLGVDTSREALPYDYVLLEYCRGEGAGDVYAKASSAERSDLSRQLGTVARELHALDVSGFGYGDWDAARGKMGGVTDWHEHSHRGLRHQIEEVRQLGLMPASMLDEVARWVERHIEAVPEDPRPTLLHEDLAFGNVLAERREGRWTLGTVFDFEWGGIGSAAAEFSSTQTPAADDPIAAEYLDAYAGGERLSPAFIREAHLYRMSYHLALMVVGHKHWGGGGIDRHTRRIDSLLRDRVAPFFRAAGYGETL